MDSAICRQAERDEFNTAEGCAILEISNDCDDAAVSIARARVAPGTTTAWHQLRGTAERYLITAGQGRVEVGKLAPAAVATGDVVRIAPDTPQRITNTGDCDLVFYAICSPRFAAGCYVALE